MPGLSVWKSFAAAALCVGCLFGCKGKKASDSLTDAYGIGVTFQYDLETFRYTAFDTLPKKTIDEYGGDIPYGASPAGVRVWLRYMHPLPANDSDGYLNVIPVTDSLEDDFAQAYPSLAKSVAFLRKTLKSRPKGFGVSGMKYPEIPEWDYTTQMSPAFYAKMRYIDAPWFSGILYVVEYGQDANPVTNENLYFALQGLSRDGKYYIDAHFPVRNAAVPANRDSVPAPLREEVNNDVILKSIRKSAKLLESAPDSSYEPSLGLLTQLLSTLKATPETKKALVEKARTSVHVRGDQEDRSAQGQLEFILREGTCEARWTLRRSPPELADLSRCGEPLQTKAALFGRIWALAREGYMGDFLGYEGSEQVSYRVTWKVQDSPDLQIRLIWAAMNSPDWNLTVGIPVSGTPEEFMQALILKEKLIPEIDSQAVDLELSAVENLSVQSASVKDPEHALQAGQPSKGMVPAGGTLIFTRKEK